MSLASLAERVEGKLVGADCDFSQLSTDTRSLVPGAAYLALSGANFDGNDFVGAAAAAGACAAIVTRADTSVSLPQLVVDDTHRVLGQIAASNRQQARATVIALTGSQGKTSVKEMTGSILAQCDNTLITEANLNNTIGVPLTLLRLNADHRFAVIEMGANAAGEIDFSSKISRPDIALITNASAAHIEGFGSLQGIVRAKGEILDGLADEGIAVLNADDPHVEDWARRAAGHRVVRFSLDNAASTASYRARAIQCDARGRVAFTLCSPRGEVDIKLQLLGRHAVGNALAAAAVAMEAGADLDQVATGLAQLQPVKGRLCPLPGIAGSSLIDDTYNASPGSFRAAIDVLVNMPGEGILVAGDMKELGSESIASHQQVGEYARQAGVTELWATGEHCRHMVASFGQQGRHFETQKELIQHCHARAQQDLVFLVKGSRGAHMDVVIAALQARGDA